MPMVRSTSLTKTSTMKVMKKEKHVMKRKRDNNNLYMQACIVQGGTKGIEHDNEISLGEKSEEANLVDDSCK